ncbi:hypothetical protein BDV26DRAFT_268965 [Aspergillus bertholletiae]|uniref:Bacteriophage T5 Orf172 DNA-binding domain-containing protein n=1 Tax=Aspergillus bertholletiae TaxID=1226010 RepID=A0A5N7AYN6_9EURO|nr:hypothetical protein BDV26DRAFT_268965 [Aspergillus bertholletiae]
MSPRPALFAAASNNGQHTPQREKSHVAPSFETPDSVLLSDDDGDGIPAVDGSPSPAARRATTRNKLPARVEKGRIKVGNVTQSSRDQTIQAYLSQVPDNKLHQNPQRRLLESCSPESRPASSSVTPEEKTRGSTKRAARNRRGAANPVTSDRETGDSPNRLLEMRNSTASPSSAPDDSSLTVLPGDETEISNSTFSSPGQPDTPPTEISDGGSGNRELTPEPSSNPRTTEDIIRDVMNVLYRSPNENEMKPTEGYAYILYDPSTQTGRYKIGRSSGADTRIGDQKTRCDLKDWEGRKEPAFQIRHYVRLESLVHAELKNLRYQFKCECRKNHREYFWGDRGVGSNVLASWAQWLREKEPFDGDYKLKDFWVDRLNMAVQYPSSSFTCMATKCVERTPGEGYCPDCVRAGWQTFMTPSREDHFDYFSRVRLPYFWARWILRFFYMCTPSWAAWIENAANSIDPTRKSPIPFSNTSFILIIRALCSLLWLAYTRTFSFLSIINIFMVVLMIADLCPSTGKKGSVHIAESSQSPKATKKSRQRSPKTKSAAPTRSGQIPERDGGEVSHVGVSNGGASNEATRANQEHSDPMHQETQFTT